MEIRNKLKEDWTINLNTTDIYFPIFEGEIPEEVTKGIYYLVENKDKKEKYKERKDVLTRSMFIFGMYS